MNVIRLPVEARHTARRASVKARLDVQFLENELQDSSFAGAFRALRILRSAWISERTQPSGYRHYDYERELSREAQLWEAIQAERRNIRMIYRHLVREGSRKHGNRSKKLA